MRPPDWLRAVIPRPAKAMLRSWHRHHLLTRGMHGAAKTPVMAGLPERVIGDLMRGWDNDAYAANPGFIRAIVRHSWNVRGPVLECGSGLSTLIAGLIAQRTGNRIWSLEHDPFWAERCRSALRRYGIDCVTVCLAPVRNFGDYDWYDTSGSELPEHFALAICDGPPGDMHGGRYGLLPECIDRLDPGCIILLHDAQRQGEQDVLNRWSAEYNTSHELEGTDELIACVQLAGSAV